MECYLKCISMPMMSGAIQTSEFHMHSDRIPVTLNIFVYEMSRGGTLLNTFSRGTSFTVIVLTPYFRTSQHVANPF